MKFNNFFIGFALSIAIQPLTTLSSAVPQEAQQDQQSQSYYQQYAPQFMQDTTNYISKKYEDTVGKWTVEKRLAVAGAIIATLVGVYNRGQIIQWINDILSKDEIARLMNEIIVLTNEETKAQNFLTNINQLHDVKESQRQYNNLLTIQSEKHQLRNQIKLLNLSPENKKRIFNALDNQKASGL